MNYFTVGLAAVEPIAARLREPGNVFGGGRILYGSSDSEGEMFIGAIVLFAVAAVVGVTMMVLHFRGVTPPRAVLAALHGVLAATGLVLLLLAVLNAGAGGAAGWALGLFVLAALGGFVLLSFHLRGRALPSGLVVGHGAIAVIAFIVLLSAVFLTTA